MKKFFHKLGGKDKAPKNTTEGGQSATTSRQTYNVCYTSFEKSLSKLHQAAWNGDVVKVTQLARKNPSLLDKHNRTPLHIACARGHTDVVTELLQWKAKINVGDNAACTPLMKAVENKQVQCAELMLEAKADANAKDISGEVCLHYAVRADHLQMVEALLRTNNIDINITNQFGQTPLHIGATYGCVSASRVLLQASALVDVQDIEGCTPLMNACQEGDVAMVTLLLEYNADTQIKDAKGWTADDIAVMSGKDKDEECRTAMKEKNAQRSGHGRREVVEQVVPMALPAVDLSEDVSEVDNTLSRRSVGPGDSWAESESEMELEVQKKISRPITSPPAPPSSRVVPMMQHPYVEDADEQHQKKPGLGLARFLKDSTDSADDKLSDHSEASDISGDLPLEDMQGPSAAVSRCQPDTATGDREKGTAARRRQLSSTSDFDSVDEEEEEEGDNIADRDGDEHEDKHSENEISDAWDSECEEMTDNEEEVQATGSADKLPSYDSIMNQVAISAEHPHQQKVMNEEQVIGLRNQVVTSALKRDEIHAIEPVCDVPSPAKVSCRGSPYGSAENYDQDLSADVVMPIHFDDETGGAMKDTGPSTERVTSVKSNSMTKDPPKGDMYEPESSDFDDTDDDDDFEEEAGGKNSHDWLVRSNEENGANIIGAEENNKNNDDLKKAAELERQEQQLMAERLEEVEKTQRKQHNEMRELEEDMKEDLQEEYMNSKVPLIDNVQQYNVHNWLGLSTTQKDEKLEGNLVSSVKVETQVIHTEKLQSNDHEQRKVNELKEDNVQKKMDDNFSVPCEDNEDDTFDDIHVPDMDSPRRVHVTNHPTFETMPQVVSDMTGFIDDDGLSYSSTEMEASVHDPISVPSVATNVNLTSGGTDAANAMRMLEQMREMQRRLDRERSARITLENRRKAFDREKADFIQKLQEVTRAKSALEQTKIELESNIRSMLYNINEECEKRRNAEVLHIKMKELFSKKEEQHLQELEAKQKIELAMRNVQMELRSSQSSMKQLEDEHKDLLRQLQHEKNARALQEKINSDHLQLRNKEVETATGSAGMWQQELSAAMQQLEATDGDRQHAFEELEKKKAELYAVKMELERTRTRHENEHAMLASENKDLYVKIDQLKMNIKLNEDALDYASLNYNKEMSAITVEVTKLKADLERATLCKEQVQSDLTSLQSRYQSTSSELEKALKERSELEKAHQKALEQSRHTVERQEQELSHVKHDLQNYTLRLSEAENKTTKVENELSISGATLVERSSQLATILKEVELRRSNQDTLTENIQTEKEENIRLRTKMESTQEKLVSLQHENIALKTALEDGGKSASTQQMDLVQLQAEHNKEKSLLEEKISSLTDNLSRLRDELRTSESGHVTYTQQTQQLQLALNEANHKLVVSETSLEKLNKDCDQMERERLNALAQLETAKTLQADSETRMTELVKRAELAEQRLADQMGQRQDMGMTQSEVEAMHKLEVSYAEVKCALKHEEDTTRRLTKELEEANQVASNLRNLASSDTQDAHRLENQIAQLEKEREQSQKQLEEEKRKVHKLLEMKRADLKVEAGSDNTTHMKKEIHVLRSHLKAARKRLKENKEDRIEFERRVQAEQEEKSRVYLNTKLADVNSFLDQQARARDQLDAQRDSNESEQQRKFEQAQQTWQETVQRLRSRLKESLSQQRFKESEVKRYKDLYETEQKLRERLSSRFERVNDHSPVTHRFERNQFGRSSFGGALSRPSWLMESTSNADQVDSLDEFVKQALDRSIKQHLEKEPHIDIAMPARSFVPPLSKSNTEYMNALQKKYFV